MKLCMACMNEYSDSLFRCPACGCTTLKNGEGYLQTGTMLAERYIIGKVLSKKANTISYISKDTDTGSIVVVKEYFPEVFLKRLKNSNECCKRERIGEEILEEDKTAFEEKSELFASLFGLAGSAQYTDNFEENGTMYYVREYIEGVNFAEYSKSNSIDLNTRLYVLKNVMAYVQLLHNSGTVHGSITPENVIISTNGKIHVTDFAFSDFISENNAFTAPELKNGGEHTVKSDVYSVSALAYFAYTGRTPDNRLTSPVSIPEDTARTIMYGMAKKLDERCASVSEFFGWLFPTEKIDDYISSKTKPIKKKKSGLRGFAAVVSAAAVMLAGGSILGMMKFNTLMHEKINKSVILEEVVVPDLSGLTLEEATTQVKRLGLTVKASDKAPSGDVGQDGILLQYPANGDVCNKGDIIYVTVSSGVEEEKYLVSKYTGMKFREVSTELDSAGINIEIIEDTESILPAGTITNQSIESGVLLEKGSTIQLTISSGNSSFNNYYYNVPRFKGINVDKISTATNAEHFTYQFVYEYSSDYIEGIIFAQSVPSTEESGNSQLSGTEITLYVSRGVEKVSVPDTQYKEVNSASEMLINAGLQADIRYEQSDNVAKDHVIYQTVNAKEMVNRGSTVTIYVSSGGKYDTYEEEYVVTIPATTTKATTTISLSSTTTATRAYVPSNTYPSYTYATYSYATTYYYGTYYTGTYSRSTTTSAWSAETVVVSSSKNTGTTAVGTGTTAVGTGITPSVTADTSENATVTYPSGNSTTPTESNPTEPVVTDNINNETPSVPVETYIPEPVETTPSETDTPYVPDVTEAPYTPVETEAPYTPPVVETTPVVVEPVTPVTPETPVIESNDSYEVYTQQEELY